MAVLAHQAVAEKGVHTSPLITDVAVDFDAPAFVQTLKDFMLTPSTCLRNVIMAWPITQAR
jgi:hypothetical protein